jgi:cob(I)alamin adenosyltransferase
MNGNQPIQQQPYQQPQGAPVTGSQGGPPPLSQDLASLANILTQIQYDLFDISVQLAQPPDPTNKFDPRVDEKAVSWINDLINKISQQLPAHQDPILPVGSQLACEFYQAKSICQRCLTELSLFYGAHENVKPGNYQQIVEYLQALLNLMFIVFRWSNLAMGEKEWFWKTKDQMSTSNTASQQQQPTAGQPQTGVPATVSNPNAPGVSKV